MREPRTDHILSIEELKHELEQKIKDQDYNLLDPAILNLSCELDRRIVPLFQEQLKNGNLDIKLFTNTDQE